MRGGAGQTAAALHQLGNAVQGCRRHALLYCTFNIICAVWVVVPKVSVIVMAY